MILKAAQGAFMETAGTSPEGMKCGASHFLIYSVAQTLREESIWTFNLGTGEPKSGLSLFKTRFGATPVSLEFARFYFGSDLHRKLTNAVHSFRRIFTGR
jgi:hypothetical protein